MCGILGVRKSWLSKPAPIEAAMGAMAWRGPDGAVLREDGDWTMAVARLAISDPEASQPIRCPRTGRWALFNGAVTSARAEWGKYGDRARTRNDAELALHRLEAHGPAGLAATSGPYALAVVDPRQDALWLARDPEGEKPLFVLEKAGRVVAFASSVASLRALGVNVALSPSEQARVLRYGFHLGPTCDELLLRGDLRGVHEALPGAGLQPVQLGPAPSPDSPLRAVIQRAVERCATAEVPVALALSGGVDSSCLAAAMQTMDRPVAAYQFQAEGEPGTERRSARLVASLVGLDLRPVQDGPEVLQALSDLTRYTGLPQGDPSVLAAHALARVAASDGVRVLLSGEGADELWLGYRRHRAAAWLPARGLECGWLGRVRGLGTGTASRLIRALHSPAPYDALLQVAPPAFLNEILEPHALPAADLPGAGEGQPSLSRAMQIDRRYYLRCDLLPKLDTATMAAGVEGRCPYLDPEVLAAAREQEGSGRQLLSKRPLKRAFREDLPSEVLHQKKRGFGLPLDRWLREDSYLPDLLMERRTLERGPLRAAGLRRMLDLHRERTAHLGHALYLVAALEVYWRYLETAA